VVVFCAGTAAHESRRRADHSRPARAIEATCTEDVLRRRVKANFARYASPGVSTVGYLDAGTAMQQAGASRTAWQRSPTSWGLIPCHPGWKLRNGLVIFYVHINIALRDGGFKLKRCETVHHPRIIMAPAIG
jgi:hypothetical protein